MVLTVPVECEIEKKWACRDVVDHLLVFDVSQQPKPPISYILLGTCLCNGFLAADYTSFIPVQPSQ